MAIYGVVGAGGLGREVMPMLKRMIRDCDQQQYYFVVEDAYYSDEEVNGHPVLKLEEFIELPGEKYYSVAIADSNARERIAGILEDKAATPISVYAETHVGLESNTIGPGAVFANFTHVTSNVKIGKQFQCNYYSYVAHDVIIGDYVTFAPGVKCNGHVVICDHAYIGAGAVIKDGSKVPITIGEGAVIGMGAVVTKSVPPRSVVVGNPARPLKR